MSKVQSFLQYSSTPFTATAYMGWAMGIGSALSTIGWEKTSDAGNVNWSNILTTVTTFTITAVATASDGTTVYTTNAAIATANQYQGYLFVITGLSATNNNGTYFCVSNTSGANATLTLSNGSGTSASSQSGTATATYSTFPTAPNWGTYTAGTNSYAGAWVAGTSYSGVVGTTLVTTTPVSSTSYSFNSVTNSGVTFQCLVNTELVLTNAIPNTNNTWTVVTIPASSSGTITITVAGTGVTANEYAGWAVFISGTGTTLDGHTFICASNTATSGSNFTITLQTYTQFLGGGTAIVNASSTAGTLQTFASNTSYANNTGSEAFISINAWFPLQVVISGFTNGGNNGNFNVVVCGETITTFSSVVVVNNSTGVLETHAGTLIAGDVPPQIDTFHWMPYNYEIWKSNGSVSSTSPIYFKLVYGVWTAATDNPPTPIISVGSSYTITGTVGGNNTGEYYLGAEISTGVGNTFECDFSGDADNFAMILWRNAASVSVAIPDVLFIDRARDQYGNSLSTYFNVGIAFFGTAGSTRFWTLFQSGVGGTIGPFLLWPMPFTGTITALSYAGMTPVLPIFPLPGYVANPVLEAICMKTGDFTDGELINAVLYGTSHTFMMSKSAPVDTNGFSNTYPGIRWE